MASPSSLLSEDQFTCSICLDIFTEPVSISCGHNFCKACITRHWEGKMLRQCPLCNDKSSKGLKLCVNTGFREVVESYRKLSVAPTTNDVHVKPGEVPCDRCSGRKFKATKSCLVCLASYCDSHQEPHRRVAALKKHKLTYPVPDLKTVVCKEHNCILELFCRNDKVCVCVMCPGHKTHDTVPLEQEYEEIMTRLEQIKVETKDLVQEREKKVQELNADMETKRRRNNDAKMCYAQVVSALIDSVQISMCGVMREIDEKQRVEERQAEVLVSELQNEISALQRRIRKLENVPNAEGTLQIIKCFLQHSSSPLPRLKNWSDVSVSGQHRIDDVRKALRNLEETLTKETERAHGEFQASCSRILCEQTVTEGRKWFDDWTASGLEALPEGTKLLVLRECYGVDMSFDPSSVSEPLVFSDDFKKVQTSHIWWCQDDVPQQFNRYSYVLGKTGLSAGRFYYEVEVRRKTGWDLGVVRKSVRGEKKITAKPSNGIWIIRLRDGRFSAMSNVPFNLSLKKPKHIGVFVDYDEGLVSFYDVNDGTLIYSFTKCKFNERILPFFSPGLPEGGLNICPLVLSSTSKEENKSVLNQPKSSKEEQNPNFTTMIITLVFVLVYFFAGLLQS